jgi:hypothetical protein
LDQNPKFLSTSPKTFCGDYYPQLSKIIKKNNCTCLIFIGNALFWFAALHANADIPIYLLENVVYGGFRAIFYTHGACLKSNGMKGTHRQSF